MLTSFLLGGPEETDLPTLRAADLGSYAFATLPPADPRRREARADFLAALSRHYAIRAEIVPLIAAWRDAGIETLLFKGFHLAEFVYPAAGMRFHGDVDVVLDPSRMDVASRIAADQGWWLEHDAQETRTTYRHEALILSRPQGATRMDVQRFVVHSRSRMNRKQGRITRAVLAASSEVPWQGTTVRIPSPVDALLILALQRGWGDGWRLKPHDPLDVRHLAALLGTEWRERARERARELECALSFELFLSRCDPEAGRLRLHHPARHDQMRWNLVTVRERPSFQRTPSITRAPGLLVDIAGVLPWLLRARRAVRRPGGVYEKVSSFDASPFPAEHSPVRERRRVVRAIRWGLRLLPGRRDGDCLVRSLAVFGALRSQGWPVVFVSGVRRGTEGVVGHAWVELDGQPLPELGERLNGQLYSVNVRYPTVARGGE